ncbi:MAG: hypothetical protein VYB37_00760, partial [Pseudomonadota bacterium]|nr:hypothetical protein [Pseudomonadota bacterium]
GSSRRNLRRINIDCARIMGPEPCRNMLTRSYTRKGCGRRGGTKHCPHFLEEYDVAELDLAFRQVPDQWVDQREPG